MRFGSGRVEGAWLEGLRDGRGPRRDHWGHGRVEECRERGWLGGMGNRGLMGKGRVEEWREAKLDSWSDDGVGDGWDSCFNWKLVIQPDSKSVLGLGAGPEGKPRRTASPAALSGDGRSQPS